VGPGICLKYLRKSATVVSLISDNELKFESFKSRKPIWAVSFCDYCGRVLPDRIVGQYRSENSFTFMRHNYGENCSYVFMSYFHEANA
jgi:hypothetical protein